MFAKAKQRLDESVSRAAAATRATAAEARPMPSIIGPDMKVTGNLATPGEVHVDGEIEGDVACAKLTVGATGWIKGAISAASVRVHGRVGGSITADEVYLLSGASVNGDIIQVTLEIAPGAEFEGAVRRSRKPAARVQETAPADTASAPAAAEPADTPLELTQEVPAPAAAAEIPADTAAEETAPTEEPAPAETASAGSGTGEDRNRGYENRQAQFRRRDQHQHQRPNVPNGAA